MQFIIFGYISNAIIFSILLYLFYFKFMQVHVQLLITDLKVIFYLAPSLRMCAISNDRETNVFSGASQKFTDGPSSIMQF